MSAVSTVAGTAFLLATTSAIAATPVLSGSYIGLVHYNCQPTLSADFAVLSQKAYADGLTLDKSTSVVQMVTLGFNKKKGTVAVTGFEDFGSIFLLSRTGAETGMDGLIATESPVSAALSYSNTAAKLTLQGVTYDAAYGQLDTKGVAHDVVFIGKIVNNLGDACAVEGKLTLK